MVFPTDDFAICTEGHLCFRFFLSQCFFPIVDFVICTEGHLWFRLFFLSLMGFFLWTTSPHYALKVISVFDFFVSNGVSYWRLRHMHWRPSLFSIFWSLMFFSNWRLRHIYALKVISVFDVLSLMFFPIDDFAICTEGHLCFRLFCLWWDSLLTTSSYALKVISVFDVLSVTVFPTDDFTVTDLTAKEVRAEEPNRQRGECCLWTDSLMAGRQTASQAYYI